MAGDYSPAGFGGSSHLKRGGKKEGPRAGAVVSSGGRRSGGQVGDDVVRVRANKAGDSVVAGGRIYFEEFKAELEALSVSVPAKAGETGQLFGSVSTKDVALAIKQAGGPDLDRQRLVIDHAIKHVGDHQVTVQLHPEVTASITVAVTAS